MRLIRAFTMAGLLTAVSCMALGQDTNEPARARIPTLDEMQVPGTSPRAPLLFAMNCMGCHGGDGLGVGGKIPPLNQMIDFMLTPQGRAFLIRVPGASNSSLTDAQLTDVLNWMVAYFSPKDRLKDWPAFTLEEIIANRRHSLTEVKDTRGALVDDISKVGKAPDKNY